MNLPPIYQEIEKQERYLEQNFPPISLAFLEYPDREYQKYNLLRKHQSHHFQKVVQIPEIDGSNTIRPTTDIIDQQARIYQHPNTMIEKRYRRDQDVKKLVENIISDRDKYAKSHGKITEEEHRTHYMVPDPQLAMTYYAVKGTL